MLEIDKQSFKQHLEWLVDQLALDSAPYLEERPRFAHGVLVFADHEQGETMKASLIKQFDIDTDEQRRFKTGEHMSQKIEIRPQADSGVNLNTSSPEFEDFRPNSPQILEDLRKGSDLPFVPLSKYVKRTVRKIPSPLNTPADQGAMTITNRGINAQFTDQNERSSISHLSTLPERSIVIEEKRTSISNTEIPPQSQKTVPYATNSILSPRKKSGLYEERQLLPEVHRQGETHRESIISVPRQSFSQEGGFILTEGGGISIPPLVGTYYERPEIVHRSYRSHVEQTTFPSIDRFRTVRQETVSVFENPRRNSVLSPTSHCSSSTPTFTSLSSSIPSQQHPDTDAIDKAVKILQDSCEMLDETAERIANRHPRNSSAEFALNYPQQYTSAFQFPSELRTTNY